jgi:hypothetical protein
MMLYKLPVALGLPVLRYGTHRVTRIPGYHRGVGCETRFTACALGSTDSRYIFLDFLLVVTDENNPEMSHSVCSLNRGRTVASDEPPTVRYVRRYSVL